MTLIYISATGNLTRKLQIGMLKRKKKIIRLKV